TQLGEGVSIALVDLRAISPWDREMVEASVRKAGRLIVVQEDTESCSGGQMLIAHLAGRPDVWRRLASPPLLVSKGNVMIGNNPIYEYTALPDGKRIVHAVHRVMSGGVEMRGAGRKEDAAAVSRLLAPTVDPEVEAKPGESSSGGTPASP